MSVSVAETDTRAGVGDPFPAARRVRAAPPWPVLGVVSAGGVLGALARYGLGVAYPHPAAGFPWVTFAVNVSGCLLIGVLMVLITDVWSGHRLLRTFLGTGMLGGYTTFSTYMFESNGLIEDGAWIKAGFNVIGSVIVGLLAVRLGIYLAAK